MIERTLFGRKSRAHAPAVRAGILAAALLAAGCAATPDRMVERSRQRAAVQSCTRIVAATSQGDVDPDDVDGTGGPAGRAALPGFSPQAVRTAQRVGVLALLTRFAGLPPDEAMPSEAARLQAMRTRLRLGDGVLLAMLDVQGVVAELECERDRGARLQLALGEAQGRRDRRLALLGVVVGAATSIVSGGLAFALPDSNRGDVAGIVGGGAEAAIGAAGLSGGSGEFLGTRRNMLRELWDGPPEPRLFPKSVWRFLMQPAADGSPGTVRDALLAQWRADVLAGDAESDEYKRREALLFGSGGRYEPEDLQLRETLIDQLQSRVWLISLELEQLMREVIRHRSP